MCYVVPVPTISIASSDGPYYLGKSAEFTCTAEIIDGLDRGNIIARFTWQLSNDTEMLESDDQYQITAVGDLVSRLTISSLIFAEDVIVCSATTYSDVNINIESQSGSDSLILTFECELKVAIWSQVENEHYSD